MCNLKDVFGVGLALSLLQHTSAAATFSPTLPPSYPLAVRSPYLSAWLPGDLVSSLPSSSPQFWYGNELTWSIMARVDDVAYVLMGVPDPPDGAQHAVVTQANFTSVHSTFNLIAGSTTFTLDFMSPVSPKNYLRQSLPFSYLTVTVSASPEDASTVQIYSDIDDTWTGQSSSTRWDFSVNGTTAVYRVRALGTATYSENDYGQALWGEAVYSTRPAPSGELYSASGPPFIIRSQFVSAGTLSGYHDTWSPGGVVAFVHDLGSVTEQQSVTYAIGHVRDEAIDFLGDAQTGYYRATYADTSAAVSHFLDDYEDSLAESRLFDTFIQAKGEATYGSHYSAILALSVRQVFGGMEITIPDDSLNTGQARAFIKEISSDGNVNTVDVTYATFPMLYILNPALIKLLIVPVFEYMSSGAYDKPYAVHDIGARYPNATGHSPYGETMPVEESGNIILLTYAYQHGSGLTDLASTYASLLAQYADYLDANGEYPAPQLSVNDALGPLANQTNLGVKAAVGLAAYGALTAQPAYQQQGTRFADAIYSGHLGTNADGAYFTIQYGVEPWFLVFNLYPDVLFGLGVFADKAYAATSAFYPSVRSVAGVALDGSVGWGQTNWQSYVAATVDGEARQVLIEDLYAYLSNGLNAVPFSDRYWVDSGAGHVAGQYYAFRARPTLGSHFALLALEGADQWAGYQPELYH